MIDIITHGSPCQDFSIAGKGKGGEVGAGTRSSLMHTTVDLVKDIRPKYVVWENVKNVLSPKHRPSFDAYVEALDELGYNSYHKVLNAKHYGIPQNRERIFCISILKSIDFLELHEWPEPFDNGIRLKHLLEETVDEKYYLSWAQTSKLTMDLRGGALGITINMGEVKEPMEGQTALCLPASYYKGLDNHGARTGIAVKEATKQGYSIANAYDGVNIGMPDSQTRRGRVGVGVAHTLQTTCDQGVLEPNECKMLGHIEYNGKDQLKRVYSEDGIAPTLSTMQGGMQEPKTMHNYRIRKLTPLECWRLMGFTDEAFYLAKEAGISDSQLYKQAGNSIVVDVLGHIFSKMFAPGITLNMLSLFSGIGAFEFGLEAAGVKVNLINYCEIDKFASKSYSTIHGVPESMNLWDVTKIDGKKIAEEEKR